MLESLRSERWDRGRRCIHSVRSNGWLGDVSLMNIQQGGYVGGRIEEDWVIAALEKHVDLLRVVVVVCRVWEEWWALRGQ
jgi:hypothetical protein